MPVPLRFGNAFHGTRPGRSWHWQPAGIAFWVVLLVAALLWVGCTAAVVRALT